MCRMVAELLTRIPMGKTLATEVFMYSSFCLWSHSLYSQSVLGQHLIPHPAVRSFCIFFIPLESSVTFCLYFSSLTLPYILFLPFNSSPNHSSIRNFQKEHGYHLKFEKRLGRIPREEGSMRGIACLPKSCKLV